MSHPAPHGGASVAPWLWDVLRCPVHGERLVQRGDSLACAHGESYPVIDGIPVLLRSDVRQTHDAAARSLAASASLPRAEGEREALAGVDAFVQRELVATNGHMYRSLAGRLQAYPIPKLRLAPTRRGDLLLDVGCNWGRWCVAAHLAGFRPVGIDPSLDAVRAAYRVARQLDIDAQFLVADARYLPFAPQTFDVVHSYSVWQHFAEPDTALALGEAARVLKTDGRAFVQMANAFGLRSLYHQARRGFRRPRDFEVRYWRPSALARAFAAHVGPAALSVDGYFSLNPQVADVPMLPRRFRWVVSASDALRRASRRVPGLLYLADSLYVTARKTSARPWPAEAAASVPVRRTAGSAQSR